MSDPGTSDAQRCPQCGEEFDPATSPLGVCPACLLKLGVSDPAWRPSAADSVLPLPPVRPLPPSSTGARVRRRPGVIWIAAAAALVAVVAFTFLRVGTGRNALGPLAAVVRFSIPLPDRSAALEGAQFAVSPDGSRIALAARGADGRQRLWVRPLQSMEWQELAGTEGAALPFWSPDSRAVAFFGERKLKRIDLSNGLTHTLCDAPSGRGGAWGSQNVIVFAPTAAGPLARVSGSGGTPQPITSIDQGRGETSHAWPGFLPDGRNLLFVVSAAGRSRGDSAAGLYTMSLDSGDRRRRIVDAGGAGVFAQGFLVYLRGTALVAQRFDLSRMELTGDVQRISGAEPIDATAARGAGLSTSAGGVLIHNAGDLSQSHLMWFDRSGRAIGQVGEPGSYEQFSLSPDGRRVAVARRDARDATSHIRLTDLARDVTSRLTIGPSQDSSPLWSPDGARIVFASHRDGVDDLYATDATGGGKEQVVHRSPESKHPTGLSPDGRFLLYSTDSTGNGSDLWMLPLDGDRKPQPFLQTPFNESDGRFSPDGRWVAYVSDESGRDEVYVRPFPGPDGRWQVSAGGGVLPRWRLDGRELFFVSAGKLVAVDVQAGSGFHVTAPRILFAMEQAGHYDVSGDGHRFLVKMPVRERDPRGLQVILNWTAELRQDADSR